MHRSGVAMGDVVEDVVDDVLADALLAAAPDVDDGRAARELRRVLAVVGLELVAIDRDRKIGDRVVCAHAKEAIEWSTRPAAWIRVEAARPPSRCRRQPAPARPPARDA